MITNKPYRAKSLSSNKWLLGYLCEDIDHNMCIQHRTGTKSQLTPVSINTIGMYTGATAKNSRAIYTGDILQYSFCVNHIQKLGIYSVVYNSELYCYASASGCSLMDMLQDTDTLIGNIYDNPELLEED